MRLSVHDKVLSKCFEALLSRTCIRSTGILEKTSRANMTAISISVYDIGPMWRVNVRHTVPLFYMNTMSGRPRLFSHIEHVYHIALFAFSASKARASFTFIAQNFRFIQNKFHFA